MDVSWTAGARWMVDVRRRLRRTEKALASVIADKTYAPTTNQMMAARGKGEEGGCVRTW